MIRFYLNTIKKQFDAFAKDTVWAHSLLWRQCFGWKSNAITKLKWSARLVLYTNFDKTLVNLLHGLLNCEIVGLGCHVITVEYKTRVHCIHM